MHFCRHNCSNISHLLYFTDTLHSWRRHSDSDSSHSTQSTRSTGLLSTFHPTATLPRPAVSTLSYTPADSTARQHALPSSSPHLHPAVPMLSYTPSDSRAQHQHSSLGEVAVLSSSHTPSVAVVHAMPQCVGEEGEGHSPAGHEDQPPDAGRYCVICRDCFTQCCGTCICE